MKIKKSFYILLLLPTIIICSCSNEALLDGSLGPEDAESQELKSDLLKFAENYEDAYAEVLTTRSDSITKEYVAALQGLDKCVNAFTNSHDLYQDLSQTQKERLVVSEDSAKIMILDTNVLLSFVKKNKSEEFYEIMRQLFEDGCLNYTASDIVYNDELYLNEKFTILTMLPPNQSRAVTRSGMGENPFGTYSPESPNGQGNGNRNSAKKRECLQIYNTAVSDCNSIYNAQILIDYGAVLGIGGVVAGVAITTGGWGGVAIGALGAAGDIVAALGQVSKTKAEHTQCLHNAQNAYKECLK